MHPLALLALAIAPLAPLQPGVEVDALDAIRGLDGRWRGELGYRDYQSGDWTRLPARMIAEASTTGPYLAQRVEFDDPGHTVIGREVIAVDVRSKQLATVAFERGVLSQQLFAMTQVDITAPEEWVIVLEADGLDDERPARIRLTQERKGPRLEVTKQVRFVDGDDPEGWLVRNRLTLEREQPDASALLGTWQVDLRPSPDAPAYLKTLRIRSVANGIVEGDFYEGSPISNGVVNTAWDAVHLSFTTADGSGTYHTAAVLRGGRLEGTTHALGRSFLGVWSATSVEPAAVE
ncbi:MAG: hypothetical protein KJO43_06320 [Phycisphaerae bacterium]|nr:hypothetical protein [Phycisphaerae bacterium]